MSDMVTNRSAISDIADNKHFEFTLSENIAALIEYKNANITRQTQETTDIAAALVNVKWMNRRDLHPWRVQEEIYGLTLAEIVKIHPDLADKMIQRLETHYQRIKAEEADTLSITRSLADNSWERSLLK